MDNETERYRDTADGLVLLLIFLGFAKVCSQVLDIGSLFYSTILPFCFAKCEYNDATIIICVSVVQALLA